MPETSAKPPLRSRPEPFIGVAVVLAWLFASGGMALLAAGREDAQAAALYARAPLCGAGTNQPPAGAEPASPAQAAALECRQRLTVTLRSTSAPTILPDHIVVAQGTQLVRVEPASPHDAQLLASIPAGGRLSVVSWRGRVTELSTPFGVARAVDDPSTAAAGDGLSVAALFALAAVMALVAIGPALGRLGRGLRRLARLPALRPRLVTASPSPPAPEAPAAPFQRVS